MIEINANVTTAVSPKDIASYLWSVMPNNILSDLSTLLLIAKTAGVLFLLYLLFLIVQAVLRIRSTLRIKSIEKNVAEINKKLDSILNKKDAKKDAKDKD